MKVYVPVENLNDYACYYVYDRETIRAYKNKPALNSSSEYTDFYINSNYLEKNGSSTWGNYNSSLPVCLSSENLTNSYVYRNDFADILIIWFVIVFVIYFIVTKLIRTLLRGFRRF